MGVIALTTTLGGCNSNGEYKMKPRDCKSCVCTKCWNSPAAHWTANWCKNDYCPQNCHDQGDFDTIWNSFKTSKAGRGDQECTKIRWHLRMPDSTDGSKPPVEKQETEGAENTEGANAIQRDAFNPQTLREAENSDNQNVLKPSAFLETHLRESVPKLHGVPGTQKSEIVETHLHESALKPHSTGNEEGA